MDSFYTSVRGDGIGMQLYGMLYTMLYCELHQFKYVHTPLAKEFEDFFQLGLDEINIDTINNNKKFNRLNTNLLDVKENPIAFSNKFRLKIRQKYYQCPKNNSSSFLESSGIRIAIHCRLGDCTQSSHDKHRSRVTPLSYIEDVLAKIIKHFSPPSVSVHVYSDSRIKLDKKLLEYGFKIYKHFGENILETMHDMVCSDIFFRYGISAFSGICGIYNNNIVISKMSTDYNFKSLYICDNWYDFDECDQILSTTVFRQ